MAPEAVTADEVSTTDEIYGEMAPMVTTPIERIQEIQNSAKGNVLYMGENEGVGFYQIWKPSHARHVLQEDGKNYVREPTGARFAPLTINSQQSHENLIIGVDGDQWQEKRKALRASFVKKHLDDFADLAVKCCEDSLSDWNSPTENISYRCFDLTFSAILRYVLGLEAQETVTRGAWQALPGINRYFHNGLFTKKKIMDDSYDRDFSFCREFFKQAIGEKIALSDRGQDQSQSQSQSQNQDRALFARVAQKYNLHEENEFDQMCTDLMSVSLAGADAPSLALAWVLYAVARHPEVKDRVIKEIDEVTSGRDPTGADISKLRYTQAVVQETLRLYPPAWYTPRTNVEEDILGGVRIPPGSTVIVFQYLMHRDPQFWQDAETFMPERFLGSERPSAYMPYGWGPRYCFAADYAHFMLVTFLALILRKYDLRLLSSDPPQMNPQVNLRMKNDLHLEVKPAR